MKFLIDECMGSSVQRWLIEHKFDSIFLGDFAAGLEDLSVLEMAFSEQRVLVTCDKDFGEIVFVHRMQHHGIIYVRTQKFFKPIEKIELLKKVLHDYADDIVGNFIVVNESAVRIIKFSS